MDPSVATFAIKGLCAAPFTPFQPNGDVDYALIATHVEEILAQGCTTVFVNGTTGEGYSCSVAERQALLERWVAAAAGRLHVIAMVGAEALPDMLALAAHAAASGAAAISYQPSGFFRPEGIPTLLSLMDVVAGAAPALPLYYYHIPSKTNMSVRCDLLLDAVAGAQAQGKLRSFRGIKYSDADLHILSNCIHGNARAFDVAYGKDEQMLGALAMGAKGFVGSTYNYCGKASNKVIAAFNKGDMSQALAVHRDVQRVVDLLYQAPRYGPGGCNVGKGVMELRLADSAARAGKAAGGVYAGPPRAPQPAVSVEGLAKLKADLEALAFFGTTGNFA